MKKTLIAIVILLVAALLVKRKNMTWRQSILKTLYPIIMLKGKLMGNKSDILLNTGKAVPQQSFYDLTAVQSNGDTILFSSFKGKKVLIVNTASDCGFTGQYDELEALHQQYGNQLVILGFPSNDFKQQEKKSDDEIAAFCKINYGVSFPLMKKSVVGKQSNQHKVFEWLSNSAVNGWCNQSPAWNFCKYLIDEQGVLTGYYNNMVSPLTIPIN